MKTDKELYKIWKKYIDRPIYRVVPERDYEIILKEGINPKKNPYERAKIKLKKLIKIVSKLEEKGFVMKFRWGEVEASGNFALRVTLHDISLYAVDFTPNKKDIEYYMKLYGGAAVANIKRVTKRLMEEKPDLTRREWKSIKELNTWAKKRICKNKAFYVKGSSKVFETAHFQSLRKKKSKKRRYKNPKYLESPFGSFEHFKKVIKKNRLRKYSYRLKTGKFYLRVRKKIPAKEIKRLR